MDVRLSPEQQALRDSAAQVVDRLGPQAVGQLDDAERAAKLDAAVAASGWRELRTPEDDDAPLASGVEAAIVAEELGRGLADAPFLGPDAGGRAAAARRRAARRGAPRPSPSPRAWPSWPCVADGALAGAAAWRSTPRRRRRRSSLRPGRRRPRRWARSRCGRVEEQVDLTRPTGRRDARRGGASSPSQGRPLAADDLTRWTALGLALTSADLVGVMRGAVAARRATTPPSAASTARPIGSFQAVQHLLADAFVADGGLAQRHPPRGLGRRRPPARRGAGRRRGGQGLLRPGRPHRVRDRHPGARRHRQHLGVPRPRLPAPGAALERRARRCRAQPGRVLAHHGIGGDDGLR